MMQEVKQTQEEKTKMYSKISKRKLIEMLITCNDAISSRPPIVTTMGWACPRCGKIHSPYSVTCDCPPPTITTSGSTTLFFGAEPLGEFEQKVLNETYKKSLKKKPTRL